MRICLSLLLAFACMTAMPTISAAHAEDAQKASSRHYILDDSLGTNFYFYFDTGVRSSLDAADKVSSLDELEKRVSSLREGTNIYWQPYKRDGNGIPVLFSRPDAFTAFRVFCREHGLNLVTPPLQCVKAEQCEKYCEDAATPFGDCKSDPPPTCDKNLCSCSKLCL